MGTQEEALIRTGMSLKNLGPGLTLCSFSPRTTSGSRPAEAIVRKAPNGRWDSDISPAGRRNEEARDTKKAEKGRNRGLCCKIKLDVTYM